MMDTPLSTSTIHRAPSSSKSFLHRRIATLNINKIDESTEDTWGPFGLTLLKEPSESLIDFVFVHGLGGGSRKTWSKTASIAHFWPQEWLPMEPCFKNVRIHSFGYHSNWRDKQSSHLTIHDFGQALLGELHNSPILNRNGKATPLVLVGHSMGGIVIKKVLLLAKQSSVYSRTAARIHSLFFLATPHRGSNMADLLRKALKVSAWHSSKPFVNSLIPNSDAIQVINDQFRDAYQGVQLWSFFETLRTQVGVIVDKSSAVLELPGEHVQLLNADHSNICKYEDPSDSNYCTLRNAFASTITSIEKTSLLPSRDLHQKEMETLFSYLSLVDRPGIDLASIVDQQTEGSCTWLTDKSSFHNWQEGLRNSPQYYWLRGEPASEQCNCDCSYFFFKDHSTGKSTVVDLLRSLAWQMAYANSAVREKILNMQETEVKIEKGDERSIWRTVFATRIFRTAIQQPQYWIIDALDECANYATLFPLLSKINAQFALRVFITSRPLLGVERAFSRESIIKVSESISLEASLGDIKLFLGEHSRYLLANSESEREQLLDMILEKSNGNFLWTSLVVKALEDAVSTERVHMILNSLPREIDALYSQISQKVLATPGNAEVAKAILRWVVCASRPLFVEELHEALKLDIHETLPQLDRTAGSICGNLVYVDSQSRVQTTHQTVRKFLFRENGHFEFAMTRHLEHSRIAQVCLTYLCSEEMKPPRFRRGNASSRKIRSPFASYATAYFSDHVARASSSEDKLLVNLNTFLQSNCLTWIEIIATSRDLSPLTQTAKNLKTYLERRAKYESPLAPEVRNISGWAKDLIHLVAQFGKPLLALPQAIFQLITSVCPHQSAIYRSSLKHPKGLQLVGISQQQWDDRLCCIVIPKTQILSVACCDNIFALGTSKGKIHIYHETTLQEESQLLHGEPVRRLAFASISTYLASVGRRKIQLWNTSTNQFLWKADLSDEILALKFDQEDEVVMASTIANCMIRWDVITGEELSVFKFCDYDEDEKREHHYRRPPIHADFSPVLGLLGVAYRQRPVSFWDLDDNKYVGQFHRSGNMYPEPFIHAFIFNPNPEINLAVVLYQDGATVVFDPEIQQIQANADTDASILAASPDGTILATGSGDGIIKLYDFETMKPLHQINLQQQNIRAIVFNSSGHRFFDVRCDYCNVWEPAVLVGRNSSGGASSIDLSEQISEPPECLTTSTYDNDLAIMALVAHHHNGFIFCGRENGTIATYSTKTGQLTQELFQHERNIAIDFLEWNERRNLLASADRSGRFTVRKICTAFPGPFQIDKPILDQNHSSVVHQILLSPDGSRFLVSTPNFDVLWDLEEASVLHKRDSSEPRSSWIWASHHDSDKLFLFMDGHVRMFEWSSFREVTSPTGIDLCVSDLPISKVVLPPRGNNICLVSARLKSEHPPTSIRLWSINSLLPEKTNVVASAVFEELGKEIKAIVGVHNSSVIFLEHSGWVCSFNTETASRERSYSRHFFVPLQWHSTLGNISMTVTPHGSIIMPVRDEIAVFHNGLDFEEKVCWGPVGGESSA